MTVPIGIECRDWEPSVENQSGKRCKHYIDGGPCALESRMMCEEWQAVNGLPRTVPAAVRGSYSDGAPGSPKTTPEPAQAPLGPKAPPLPPNDRNGQQRASRAQEPGAPLAGGHDDEPVFGLSPAAPKDPKAPGKVKLRLVTKRQIVEDPIVISEKHAIDALDGVESVQVDDHVLGPVTLVHKFTGKPRTELTFEAAHVISRLKGIFPMMELVSITMKGDEEKAP